MTIPELQEGIMNLRITDDQSRRQAVNSLRGYAYQIFWTIDAWLRLEEDEILLLEVAEDYAVIAKDVLNCTQVKDTAGSGTVTLRNESVIDTINALWDLQQANLERRVTVTYLTTSTIGKERGISFPGNQPGLNYWRIAARDGTDIEPLRQALLCIGLPTQITDFIKEATPNDLRKRIFHPINWICGKENIVDLEERIRERLVYFGDSKGLAPTDSERALDSLMTVILHKTVQKNGRSLTKADFLRTFESATSISMPKSRLQELLQRALDVNQATSASSITAVGSVLNVAAIPPAPRITERRILVQKLLSDMSNSGTLWLHGSNGTGKTVLAQLIARQARHNWVLVQLRDCSVTELEFRLCRVMASWSGKNGGVILDDFPTENADSVRLRLSMLVNEIHRMDGSIIVTSAKPPSPTLRDCFEKNGPAVVKVPYLSQEEVAELVKNAGGDPQKWAGVIYTFCWLGHPQLVQARIVGLQQREWPENDLIADIPGVGISSRELECERDAVRDRLIAKYPTNSRDLLYRIALFCGYFDRELAVELGGIDPQIEQPGEAFDILRGPWIEQMADNRFRISPLVSGTGIKNINQALQKEVHKRIVDLLLKYHPFPADFLGTLLSHALVSRHVPGLLWLTMAIIHTPDKDRRMMSEHLLLLSFLDTKHILFKEDIHVSAMLRLAQFHVTAWANQIESLPAIADQLITEAKMLVNQDVADGFQFMSITAIVGEQSLKFSPRKWMPLINSLEKLLNSQGALIKYIHELDATKKGLVGLSIPHFLFVIRARSLKSIHELVELFTELDCMEDKCRNMYLSSLDAIPHSKCLMIDSAWLAEMKEGTLNGLEAAKTYCQLGSIAEKWGDIDTVVECECARAVMLDEYANDSDKALLSLGQAEEKYPNQIRLIRKRAFVYYRRKDYPNALTAFAQIADVIPKEDHIDRAFALREAGISAANIGDYAKASHYYSEAYDAAKGAPDNMRTMAAGLKGDQAVTQYQLGDKEQSLKLLCQAIMDVEQIKFEAMKKEAYYILILGNVILRMQRQEKVKPSNIDIQIVPGCCSDPEPPEKVLEMSAPPILALWYQLAILEAMMVLNVGILSELQKRTRSQKLLSYDLVLNINIMIKYITSADIENFFSFLSEYVSKIAYMRDNTPSSDERRCYDLTDSNFPMIKPVDWTSDLHLQYAKDAILGLAATVLCSNDLDSQIQLFHQAVQNQIAADALRDFVDCFEKETCPSDDMYEVTAFHLGRLMSDNSHISPEDIFVATCRLWEWLLQTSYKDVVTDMIANYLARHWQEIIKHQRIVLCHPIIAVPAIESAINEDTTGAIKIAKILLAAEFAVNRKLNVIFRSKLNDYCLQDQKRSPV